MRTSATDYDANPTRIQAAPAYYVMTYRPQWDLHQAFQRPFFSFVTHYDGRRKSAQNPPIPDPRFQIQIPSQPQPARHSHPLHDANTCNRTDYIRAVLTTQIGCAPFCYFAKHTCRCITIFRTQVPRESPQQIPFGLPTTCRALTVGLTAAAPMPPAPLCDAIASADKLSQFRPLTKEQMGATGRAHGTIYIRK